MPTFIAVQCFQCSTMQVKQQKKSSNKWSCVVCNEKQSVRKVFAQSVTAKDVRHFVQSFNMSRQLADENQFISEDLETCISPSSELNTAKKRRTDWTEYVDDDDDPYQDNAKFDNEMLTQGNELQPAIMTEIPESLFKKPTLKAYSSNKRGVEKLWKPSFESRCSANNKRHGNDQSKADSTEFEKNCRGRGLKSSHTKVKAIFNSEGTIGLHPSNRASKWASVNTQMQHQNCNLDEILEDPSAVMNIKAQDKMRSSKGQVSKWSSFLTDEDDDDLELLEHEDPRDRVGNQNAFQSERVEDDIHPDFL